MYVYKTFNLDVVDIIILILFITRISSYVTDVLIFHNNTIFDSHQIYVCYSTFSS